MTDQTIHIADETLILMPERAVYWTRTGTLFIADTHWGKSATFRRFGLAIPTADVQDDLNRLSDAIGRMQARRLIVLGDLLHARAGLQPAVMTTVTRWREDHRDLAITLVRGNHDRHAGDPPDNWRIRVVDGPTPGPYFVLNHEPHQPENGYALTGHLHPGVALHGPGGQRLKQACFWVRADHMVLPAFASFTGLGLIQPTATDQVYAVTGQAVLPLRR
jgi:uncharacterized protein